MPVSDFEKFSVRELLSAYVGDLNQLLERGVIRTRNSPLGDLTEHIAVHAYSGVIEPNSAKSFDLTSYDGRRVQVKAKTLMPGKRTGQFSFFRSWDFDVVLFVVFDANTYDIQWARELSTADAESIGRWVKHTSSWICTVSDVAGRGTDMTERVRAAYDSLDEADARVV